MRLAILCLSFLVKSTASAPQSDPYTWFLNLLDADNSNLPANSVQASATTSVDPQWPASVPKDLVRDFENIIQQYYPEFSTKEGLDRMKRYIARLRERGLKSYGNDTGKYKPLNTTGPLGDLSSELKSNYLVDALHFEGDIVWTDELAQSLGLTDSNDDLSYVQKQLGNLTDWANIGVEIESLSNDSIKYSGYTNNTRMTREVKTNTLGVAATWPGARVAYAIDPNLRNDRAAVLAALEAWQKETCVDFYEDTKAPARIQFIKVQSGCSSPVGYRNAINTIQLSFCLANPISVAHEIGHSLGLFHEQSRYDRNEYVTLNVPNIDPDHRGNFDIISQKGMKTFGVPYDYGSALHYSAGGFAVYPEDPTIMANKAHYQQTMGQRLALSFVDIKTINLAYNCLDKCKGKGGVTCLNGGYQDPRKCQACKCPSGFGDSTCNSVQPSTVPGLCGGTLRTVNADWKEIKVDIRRPKTPTACHWLIRSPANTRIQMQVVLSAGYQFMCDSAGCQTDFIEFKTGPDFGPSGAKFCCEMPTGTFTSYTNVMVFSSFATQYSVVTVRYRQTTDIGLEPVIKFTTPKYDPFQPIIPGDVTLDYDYEISTTQVPQCDFIVIKYPHNNAQYIYAVREVGVSVRELRSRSRPALLVSGLILCW